MKIDSQIQFPDDFRSSQADARKTGGLSPKGGSGAAGIGSPTGEDTVRLSGTHSEVQSLSAALQQVPEVRGSQVTAFQEQVRSGQYQPDSGKIADALIADQAKTTKA
jgi:flagellar biosynthesis anti-sigma factor FlgM